MTQPSPFGGRVIFDHLPKTAGMAVQAWLAGALGTRCVTANLIGEHRRLIKIYGGEYSVIVAHLSYCGEGLDPRYRYITCLREPLDRAISWLYFVVNHHDESQLGSPWWQAQRFLITEGAELGRELEKNITNPYVEHFSSIFPEDPRSGLKNRTDAEKLSAAMSAIERYDVWGLCDEFAAFLNDIAALIGLPAPGQIALVNVTRQRPAVTDISAKLRKRLEELNRLDLEFYRLLRERWYARRSDRPNGAVPGTSPWLRYDTGIDRASSVPEFTLLAAVLDGENAVLRGDTLLFTVDFSLSTAVAELISGIQIIDEFGQRAFGTNTTLLKQTLLEIKPGTHRVQYSLIADLPEGKYAAGFAFLDKREQGDRELAWYDKLLTFSVTVPRPQASIGYCSLPVEMKHVQLGAPGQPAAERSANRA